jgi:hypothetical protein
MNDIITAALIVVAVISLIISPNTHFASTPLQLWVRESALESQRELPVKLLNIVYARNS